MEKYDYLLHVEDDLRTFIDDHFDEIQDWPKDERAEMLNDMCWICDGVTGNASGSYTFNAWQAEENLCHNRDLLEEAAENYGYSLGGLFESGPENCDVIIRCYLLGQAIEEVLEEYNFMDDIDNGNDE